MERTENCGTCRFWREREKRPQSGECRRNPPTPLFVLRDAGFATEGGIVAAHPKTGFSDWCGEHRRPDPPPAGGD